MEQMVKADVKPQHFSPIQTNIVTGILQLVPYLGLPMMIRSCPQGACGRERQWRRWQRTKMCNVVWGQGRKIIEKPGGFRALRG